MAISGSRQQSRVSYLSFGSNLGAREENLFNALLGLKKTECTKIIDLSSIYETAPQYFLDQPTFLNCVAKILTTLPPRELLKRCQFIEDQLGRIRRFKYGPRIIDVDILLYGNLIFDENDLIIPHPELTKRNFVLTPLIELAPDLIVHNHDLEYWRNACSDQGVKKSPINREQFLKTLMLY